eukprot:12820927-Heterocapsa_arctica.AAC.1
MEVDVNNTERILFKLFKNCGIRHYASYLDHTKCMKRITGNRFSVAGEQGTYSEHTEDIKATI